MSAILTGVGWCTAASNVAGMVKLGVVDVGASNHFGGFSEISTGCYSLTLIAHLWLTVGVGGIVRHIFGHRQYSIPAVYGYDGIQWTRHTGSTDYNSLFRFAMRLIPNAIEQLSSGASHSSCAGSSSLLWSSRPGCTALPRHRNDRLYSGTNQSQGEMLNI